MEVTPYGIDNIGYKFYIVWAVLNLTNAAIVWLFYPETAGIPLEHIDFIFAENSDIDHSEEKQPLYRKLQWSIVAKASSEFKRQKQLRAGLSSGLEGDGTVVERGITDKKMDTVELRER